MANISILGAGGWGIAIAILLDNNGNHVTIWSAVDREVKCCRSNGKMKSV